MPTGSGVRFRPKQTPPLDAAFSVRRGMFKIGLPVFTGTSGRKTAERYIKTWRITFLTS